MVEVVIVMVEVGDLVYGSVVYVCVVRECVGYVGDVCVVCKHEKYIHYSTPDY